MDGEEPVEPEEVAAAAAAAVGVVAEGATMGDIVADPEPDAEPEDIELMGDVNAPDWKSMPPLARIICRRGNIDFLIGLRGLNFGWMFAPPGAPAPAAAAGGIALGTATGAGPAGGTAATTGA